MNRADVARLLAYAAAFDRRTIGETDVLAWHDALDTTPYEPAHQAVREWYREHDRPIMPANVRALVRRRPDERPLTEVVGALPELTPMPPAVRAALANFTAKRALPAGEPDAEAAS